MSGTKKRGALFSIDALIAILLIFFVIILLVPLHKQQKQESNLQYDVLATFSTLQAHDLNDTLIANFVEQQALNVSNKSVLALLGELYVTDIDLARQLAEAMISYLDTRENIGIWYGTTLLASKNSTPFEQAKDIDVARQTITGIREGESVTGFASRAFLAGNSQTNYWYWGGYVGDGNLSLRVEYNGTLQHASMEVAINRNATVYVNNVLAGTLAASPSDMVPVTYTLPVSSFAEGVNIIELRGQNLYVSGGYIKLEYNNTVTYSTPTRHYLPGIKGIINLYDGVSIPGDLQSMSMRLHYNSTYKAIVTLGNQTLFNGTSTGETTQTFNNTQLITLFNYAALSNKTIPFRFGTENITLVQNATGNADVILITDISGSMNWRLDSDVNGVTRNCTDPLLNDPSTRRISLAKCLDKEFVGKILAGTNNRVGLVAFEQDASDYVSLTTNHLLLNQTIDSYSSSGGTCISCAINRAYDLLQSGSNSSRNKYIIVMTDGVANVRSTATCTDLYAAGTNNTLALAGGANGLLFQRTPSFWANLTIPATNAVNDIDLAPNTTIGFSVGASGRIQRWNGTSWSTITSPVTSALNGLDMFNSTYALAVGASGRVLRWNGASWSTIATISNSPTLNSVTFVNATLAFAAGSRNSAGRIYQSTNAGASWSEVYSDGENYRGIAAVNRTRAFAVGDSGEIALWNGASWSSSSSPTSQDLYRIEVRNRTEAFIVGGDNGNSLILRWNGASWASVYNRAGDSLRDLVITNNKTYIIGEGGTLAESNNSQWVQSFALPAAYEGTSFSGISCTTDQDSCTEIQSYPSLNANYSACRARSVLNTTLYSIGFGPIASCGFASQTLQSIAGCGNGTFYASSNASTLQQIYSTIAQNIVQFSYTEQTSVVTGNISMELYPDSYIEVNYTKKALPYGLLIAQEKMFSNATRGTFNVSADSTLLDARVLSYSGSRWTSLVRLNGQQVYSLSTYGQNYVPLGDPYEVLLPVSGAGSSNYVDLVTGLGPLNQSSGSDRNKVVYLLVKNVSAYSPIGTRAEGCLWQLEFEDETNTTRAIPAGYTGSTVCAYRSVGSIYDENDALQSGTLLLLQQIDLDADGKLDVKINSGDIAVETNAITGIPFTWATEVQVRIWR